MSLVSDILHGLSTGPQVRDWQHANKIFVGNNYALKPKDSYLFHVKFDINPNTTRLFKSKTGGTEELELGVLVKSVQIPKYTIETKTMNAYNRAAVIQQKIKYEPIQIAFHDDNSDVVRSFWYDYMSHYYRDSDYTTQAYTQQTKYNKLQQNFWGYQPANYDVSGSQERILNTIRIYSLHQKQFTEYILINPTITGFQHGQHVQGQADFLENTMTVAYESVLYNYGSINVSATGKNQEPSGFAQLNYDKTPSPLTPQGGGTNSILGPGGLLSSVQGISQSVNPTDENGNPTGNPNYLGAGLTALRAFNKNKNSNILGMAGTELKNIASGVLAGDTNTLNRLAIPKAAPRPGSNAVQQATGIQD